MKITFKKQTYIHNRFCLPELTHYMYVSSPPTS